MAKNHASIAHHGRAKRPEPRQHSTKLCFNICCLRRRQHYHWNENDGAICSMVLGHGIPFHVAMRGRRIRYTALSEVATTRDSDVPFPRARMDVWIGAQNSDTKWPCSHSCVGPACKVQLFDITRGLPQRIEGQFRRHWGLSLIHI